MQEERYLVAADLGTSKVALCVAKVQGEDVQVIYYKETPSDGVRYSAVYNPKRAGASLKKAIKEAETELGIRISQVLVGLPRHGVIQDNAQAQITRTDPDSCITFEEIDTLKSMAVDDYRDRLSAPDRQEVYGAVAQSFSVEDLIGVSESDIEGTTSATINANFKVFVGPHKPISNIDIALNAAEVAPASKLFIPNIVARAVLTDTEKDNGVALVEFGAGVTSVTIYRGKILRHYSSIPFGGRSVTNDIKLECGFNDSLAENIKLAFGACLPGKLQNLSDKVLQINDDETGSYEQLPVKYLSEIINCREREIVDAILYQIQMSGYADALRNGIVITGGGANMVNLSALIKERSGYNVRIGYPRTQLFSTGGCPGVCETSAAPCIGMILEGKAATRLNCIDDTGRQASAYVDGPAVETAPDSPHDTAQEGGGTQTGQLFDEQFTQTEVLKPSKGRQRGRKGGNRITWLNKVKNKASEVIDGTVGQLFDGMDGQNQ